MERIKLDLVPSCIKPVLHASQYDDGRQWQCDILNGGTPYVFQSGDTVELNLRKGDGLVVTSAVAVVPGQSYVILVSTEQMCAIYGSNLGELKLKSNGVDIGSCNFILEVEKDTTGGDKKSMSQIYDLQTQVDDCTKKALENIGANGLPFDPDGTDLESTNTEDAIKEVNYKVDHLPSVDAYTKEESNDLFATKEEIPTKTSELDNDSDFVTSSDLATKADISTVKTIDASIYQTENLFDEAYIILADGVTTKNGEYSATATALRNAFGMTGKKYPVANIEANTQYTFSANIKTDANVNNNGLEIHFVYTDGTDETGIVVKNNQQTWLFKTYTTLADKTLDYLRFSYANEGDSIWHLKDMQITKGVNVNAFVAPHNTANDGVVRNENKQIKTIIDENFIYSKISEISSGSDRAYINLGKKSGLYRIRFPEGLWCAVQGFSSSDYSGSPIFDSKHIPDGTIYYVDAELYDYYFRFVFGKNSAITKDEAVKSYVECLKVSVAEADNIKQENEIVYGEATRRYSYLGLFNGKVRVESASPVTFALQGYDSETYGGTRVIDDGAYSDNRTFTVSGNTSIYYRIAFLKSSAFTDADLAKMKVEKIVSNEKFDNQENINNESTSFVQNVIHGATDQYPANVIGLYRKAKELGIMNWECDVRPCTDGYVLCHDDDIYNHAVTASGEQIPEGTVLISTSSVAQLQAYKFGVIKNKQAEGVVSGFETDTIPTLEQFILYAKICGATPFVEIKFAASEQQVNDIVGIVKNLDMLDKTYFIVYESASAVAPRVLNAGAKNIELIIWDGSFSTSAVDTAYGYVSSYLANLNDIVFAPSFANLTKERVEYAISKGFKVNAWTIGNNTLNTLLNAFKYGVSMFTTNKPNVARIIRDGYFNVTD